MSTDTLIYVGAGLLAIVAVALAVLFFRVLRTKPFEDDFSPDFARWPDQGDA